MPAIAAVGQVAVVGGALSVSTASGQYLATNSPQQYLGQWTSSAGTSSTSPAFVCPSGTQAVLISWVGGSVAPTTVEVDGSTTGRRIGVVRGPNWVDVLFVFPAGLEAGCTITATEPAGGGRRYDVIAVLSPSAVSVQGFGVDQSVQVDVHDFTASRGIGISSYGGLNLPVHEGPPSSGSIVAGTSTADGATVATVPTGTTWRGSITIAGRLASAAVNPVDVTVTAGTQTWQLSLVPGQAASLCVPDVYLAAATGVVLHTGGATLARCSVHGITL